MVIRYQLPEPWLRYDKLAIAPALTEAKAAILALAAVPYQRAWADAMQEMELKREVAGTSRIEGAEFTEREFEEAVAPRASADMTRSQRQARAAIQTYRWLATIPPDRAVGADLILEVHRRIVAGCDDDHCAPGVLRGQDQNVTFGRPRHRGAGGGAECARAFAGLCAAIAGEFRAHDGLVQALAVHYHLGAIHPFQDGNGRTARATEAILLRRADLKDSLFVAMSNYYYDEKDRYLDLLSRCAAAAHDVTPFLIFGLQGIAAQCRRLLAEIRRHLARSLFRDVMGRMYGRLASTRKRALARRQVAILERLLDAEADWTLETLAAATAADYRDLRSPAKGFARDVAHLLALRAIAVQPVPSVPGRGPWAALRVAPRLEWATEITETEFYAGINRMLPARTRLLIGG